MLHVFLVHTYVHHAKNKTKLMLQQVEAEGPRGVWVTL